MRFFESFLLVSTLLSTTFGHIIKREASHALSSRNKNAQRESNQLRDRDVTKIEHISVLRRASRNPMTSSPVASGDHGDQEAVDAAQHFEDLGQAAVAVHDEGIRSDADIDPEIASARIEGWTYSYVEDENGVKEELDKAYVEQIRSLGVPITGEVSMVVIRPESTPTENAPYKLAVGLEDGLLVVINPPKDQDTSQSGANNADLADRVAYMYTQMNWHGDFDLKNIVNVNIENPRTIPLFTSMTLPANLKGQGTAGNVVYPFRSAKATQLLGTDEAIFIPHMLGRYPGVFAGRSIRSVTMHASGGVWEDIALVKIALPGS